MLDNVLDQRVAVERIRIDRVELRPGQRPGRHRHPCDVIGCVLAGAIRFQAGAEPQLLLAGDGFHEPAGAEILHFDDASDTEGAAFLACYLLPPGETRLIEMLPSR